MHYVADSTLPDDPDDETIWHKVVLFELIYSMTALFLGLTAVVGGIILFLHGVIGSTSWTASVLGAKSSISDAAPGSVLFIVGLFIVYITRYKIRLRGRGRKRRRGTKARTVTNNSVRDYKILTNDLYTLQRFVAEREGLVGCFIPIHYCIIVGEYPEKYQISWEPFRDLAGVLSKDHSSQPIVFIQKSSDIKLPQIITYNKPIAHFEIIVSEHCKVRDIANNWLELMASIGVKRRDNNVPFAKYLGLSDNDFTESAKALLGISGTRRIPRRKPKE